MPGDRCVIERLGFSRRAFRPLCLVISLASYSNIEIAATNAYAKINELENDYFSYVLEEILSHGFPCTSGDMGHILYEDDLIAVLEVVCESGESYEIIDIYDMEKFIIVPIESLKEEEINDRLNRVQYENSQI
jgi:hypothetical protein